MCGQNIGNSTPTFSYYISLSLSVVCMWRKLKKTVFPQISCSKDTVHFTHNMCERPWSDFTWFPGRQSGLCAAWGRRPWGPWRHWASADTWLCAWSCACGPAGGVLQLPVWKCRAGCSCRETATPGRRDVTRAAVFKAETNNRFTSSIKNFLLVPLSRTRPWCWPGAPWGAPPGTIRSAGSADWRRARRACCPAPPARYCRWWSRPPRSHAAPRRTSAASLKPHKIGSFSRCHP